jgi:carboxypeptidase family protein/TonB-dependent receptor-like protein
MMILLCGVAVAQTNTGRISGRVSDVTGAAIPGVTVTITEEGTNISREVRTGDDGVYTATNLRGGVYSVKAEHSGFKKTLKSGYTLVNDGRLSVDIGLETGDVSAMVEVVSTTGEALNSVSGEIARVVDSEQVQNLALNTRNFTELFTLIPGATQTVDDPLQLASGSSTGQATINGNRGNSVNLTVDGGYNIGPTNNSILISNVGIDFIQEVKIQTSNFSAEYGRHSGAAINVTTKGGGNQIHGTAFEFLRNEVTDARAALAPEKTALRYNNAGYSLGGPIIKGKFFFFGGQEWKFIRRSLAAAQRTLPTTAELRGDFSYRLRGADGIVGTADDGVLRNPAKPANTCVAPLISNGRITRQAVRTGCFPKNTIPADMITADGRAIASVYRTAIGMAAAFNDQPVANNATFQPRNPFDFRQDMLRLDYRFSDKHQVFGRYTRDVNIFATPYGPASESQLPVTPTTRIRPTRAWLAQYTWFISPRLTNEARAYIGIADQRSFPVGETWTRDTHGFVFPQVFTGETYDNGMPDISVTGGITPWRGPSFALVQPTTEIAWNDNMTFIAGAHTAKFGAAYSRSRLDQNGRPRYTGNVSFNTNRTNSTGNAFADALLGNYRTYTEFADDPQGRFRATQFDFYLMDVWRVSRRLSLEFGARIQSSNPYYPESNNFANFDPALYDPAQAVTVTRTGLIDTTKGGNRYNGLVRAGDGIPTSEVGRVPGATSADALAVPAGAPRGLYESSNRVAPRFSFAFSPTDNGRLAIRGGFGIFYDTPPGDIPASMLNNPPFNASVNLENGNLSNPLSGAEAAVTPFDTVIAIDPELRLPYTMNYSLSVQSELPHGLFAEAAYVGNQGRRLLRQPDINMVPLDIAFANLQLPTAQRATDNALRPYKGYSSIRRYVGDANSNYNSLQLYLAKRKGNSRFTASYTWGKTLTDASANGDNSEIFSDRRFYYGCATFDRRHIVVGTFTLISPFFRKSKGLTGALLSGYEISGKARAQTGPYLTVVANAPTNGNRRADYIGGDVLTPESERTRDNWINRDAFRAAPANSRGTGGVGMIQAPSMYLGDVSLRKLTQLTERVRLRFQFDIFNILNHPNYTGLNTNLSDVDFGRLETSGQPRQIQFGMKIEF